MGGSDSEDDLGLGFSLTQPHSKQALHEIAIVDVKWSAIRSCGDDPETEVRFRDIMTMLDTNREAMVEAVFKEGDASGAQQCLGQSG